MFNVNIITPTSREDILRQFFHQCISHESNAWRKIGVFRPDKTGKEQGQKKVVRPSFKILRLDFFYLFDNITICVNLWL